MRSTKNLQYLPNSARYDQSYYDGLIGSRLIGSRTPKSMTLDDLKRPRYHSCRNKSFTELTSTRKILSFCVFLLILLDLLIRSRLLVLSLYLIFISLNANTTVITVIGELFFFR